MSAPDIPAVAGWLLDALIASAFLMTAVLLVRAPVRRAFGPQVGYALWALPLLRLLLPPLPAGWWHATAAAPITRAGETIAVFVVEPAAPVSGLSIGTVLALLWAAGALAFLAFHLHRHLRFCAYVVRGAEPIERRDGVDVIASAAAPGPIAFGIWRRYVAFPRDFAERYDPQERALALAHELGHHARRDLLANWAALIVLALHWFSPIAWRAFQAFHADQELANDARTLAGCDPAGRAAYGRAIVKATHPTLLRSAITATCHLHTITDLKGRLKMLTNSHTSRRRVAAGTAAVTLLVAGGLGLTASSSAAEQIRIVLKAPLAPLAPAPVAISVPLAPVSLAPVPVAAVAPVQATASVQATAPMPVPVPPAPPAIGRNEAGETVIHTKDGKTFRLRNAMRLVHVDKDGRVTTQGSGPGAMPDIPNISSLNCKDGADRAPVITDEKNGKRQLIICTNRVQRLAAEGAASAEEPGSERGALANALTSLQRARASIAAERTLTDDQRRTALAGVDQAMAEMRADAATN